MGTLSYVPVVIGVTLSLPSNGADMGNMYPEIICNRKWYFLLVCGLSSAAVTAFLFKAMQRILGVKKLCRIQKRCICVSFQILFHRSGMTFSATSRVAWVVNA